MGRKTYSPSFKFQVAIESLKDDRTDAEIARAYGVHPVTVSPPVLKWTESPVWTEHF